MFAGDFRIVLGDIISNKTWPWLESCTGALINGLLVRIWPLYGPGVTGITNSLSGVNGCGDCRISTKSASEIFVRRSSSVTTYHGHINTGKQRRTSYPRNKKNPEYLTAEPLLILPTALVLVSFSSLVPTLPSLLNECCSISD